jgi:hypothetical protein
MWLAMRGAARILEIIATRKIKHKHKIMWL